MKKLLFIIFVATVTFSCNKDETNYPAIDTVAGRSYSSELDEQLHLIYRLSTDSLIQIEQRAGSVNGPLVDEKIGYYTYNHPELKLKVQSICDSCFNYFTATVSNDRRSFSYQIYDMSANEFRTLKFTLIN